MNHRISPLAATLALLVAAAGASAQSRDPSLAATRRDLIEQARSARSARDHARALDLAQRAGQIEMSLSLRRFISEEQESLGRVADAMNNAETCVREGGAARDNASHVDACRAITARLQSRVGRVTVTAPTPAPEGLRVRVAGNEVPAVVWGVPLLVTPGPVAIDAEAPSYRAFHREVTVGVGAVEPVAITLEPLPPPPPPPPAPVAVAPTPPPPVVIAAPVPPPIAPAPSGPGAGPFVLMGVGALGLGGALAFLTVASGDEGEPCADDPSLLCETASADTFRTMGWVSLGVGISAAIGGVVWFFAGRSGGAPAPRATLTGTALPGGGTLGMRLVF